MTFATLIRYWQLRTWINDNLSYLTINCDTVQHSQFSWCFKLTLKRSFAIFSAISCKNLSSSNEDRFQSPSIRPIHFQKTFIHKSPRRERGRRKRIPPNGWLEFLKPPLSLHNLWTTSLSLNIIKPRASPSLSWLMRTSSFVLLPWIYVSLCLV